MTIDGRSALLRALDIAPGQFVELRALYPREAFTSTSGMQVREGNGLEQITADEAADAAAYERDRERIDDALASPGRWLLLLLALGTLPALVIARLVFWRFGREPETGYDREYGRSRRRRPSPDSSRPCSARVAKAGAYEFPATLFDLDRLHHSRRARRDRAEHLGRAPDGAVLRPRALTGHAGRPDHLGDLRHPRRRRRHLGRPGAALGVPRRDRGRAHRDGAALRGLQGGGQRRGDEPGLVPLARDRPARRRDRWALRRSARSSRGSRSTAGAASYPRWSDVVLLGLAAAAFVNAAVLLGASTRRKLWRRRNPEAAVEAERWEAFRRYLQDFPRLDEAPPATLALWERYLVYGIAFGIADRVLQAAHLAMPEAMAEASSIYWISGTGDLEAAHPPCRSAISPRASAPRSLPLVRLGRRRRRLLGRRRGRRRRWRRRLRLARRAPAARVLVERDRPGGRHVERLGLAGQRDRDPESDRCEVRRQPLALGAEEEGERRA